MDTWNEKLECTCGAEGVLTVEQEDGPAFFYRNKTSKNVVAVVGPFETAYDEFDNIKVTCRCGNVLPMNRILIP